MSDSEGGGVSRTEATFRSLYLMASLALSLWLLWTCIPEHQRTMMRMRLLRSSAQGMRVLARRAGERSMCLELATGTEAYELPLFLSGRADALEAAYQRARGVTP